jgi:hypothetical protein
MRGASARDIRKTAQQLVYGYPHHGYVIDVGEAAELGLNVESMDAALYRASKAVAQRAFDCTVEVCDGDAHRPDDGYCGFAPKGSDDENGKEVSKREAEASLDGEPDDKRATELRHA